MEAGHWRRLSEYVDQAADGFVELCFQILHSFGNGARHGDDINISHDRMDGYCIIMN